MNALEISRAIASLDSWLETMRQAAGYGGPVAHWWQSRFRFAGPGLDWRYEGILTGYRTLLEKTGDEVWRERLIAAAQDLIRGQRLDGSFLASAFELNPRSLGTPHEAAASLGLLSIAPYVDESDEYTAAAIRNLQNLVARLWDGVCFNDRPGAPGRVPNKLATMAQALMRASHVSDADDWRAYAKAAIDEVLTFQVPDGNLAGAIGQGRPGAEAHFFPYYIARCVPALMEAADEFSDEEYALAAYRAVGFLRRYMNEDGSWPQVLYGSKQRNEWPQWRAGASDVLAAFVRVGERLPEAGLVRLLASQLPHGGFRTAEGFGRRVRQRGQQGDLDVRDVLPVVGWNDKVLAFLAELMPGESDESRHAVAGTAWTPPSSVSVNVRVAGALGTFTETQASMEILVGDEVAYRWRKSDPWASICVDALCIA